MQVQKIQNNSTNFRGSFFRGSDFTRLEQNLSSKEKEALNKIINNIEKSNDNYRWWFSFKKLPNSSVERAHIGRMNPFGLPYRPAMFIDKVEKDSDAIKVFEQLHNWYKENVKGFKG